ncbi:MAG: alpha/beta hydrolase [Pyrinomonadaceae bacterium]
MKTNSIYKSEKDKQEILKLYDQKLASLNVRYDEQFVETFVGGQTHIISLGEAGLPPVVLLHGLNAGAPMALEVIKGLAAKYRIHAIDIIGQAGKSAETRISVKDLSYGKWLAEVFDRLQLEKVPVIAVSYGAFVLQRLIAYQPQRIERAIFVVPAGIVGGSFFQSVFKLLLPMRKFLKTKQMSDLLKFMDAFYTTKDDFSIAFQKLTLLGVNMDMRRPPLLKIDEMKLLDGPVYVLAADDDVFFPAEKMIKRCRQIFKTLAETKILPNSKHVPGDKDYDEIEKNIGRWLAERRTESN